MGSERRREPRFGLRYGLYLSEEFASMSGWITNISLGGVAFDYLPTEISIPDYPVVSIYNLKDDSPIVAHLHCRTVHNTLNLSENYMFKHVVDTRHCGLQFIDPTEEDQGRLNRLMSVYQV